MAKASDEREDPLPLLDEAIDLARKALAVPVSVQEGSAHERLGKAPSELRVLHRHLLDTRMTLDRVFSSYVHADETSAGRFLPRSLVLNVGMWVCTDKHSSRLAALLDLLARSRSSWIGAPAGNATAYQGSLPVSDVIAQSLTDREIAVVQVLVRMEGTENLREKQLEFRLNYGQGELRRAIDGLRKKRLIQNRRGSGYYLVAVPSGLPVLGE